MASGEQQQQQIVAPNKTCKKCKNVPVNGLKCVKCDSVFHPGCIKYLKYIDKISETQVLCCDNENTLIASEDDQDTEDVDLSVDAIKLENTYLKKLLREKDQLISSLNLNIKSLNRQIDLIDKCRELDSTPRNIDQSKNSTSKPRLHNYSEILTGTQSKHSEAPVSKAITTTTKTPILNEVKPAKSEPDKNTKTRARSSHEKVNNTNRPKHNTVVRGTGEKSANKFKAPEKKLWVYVGRCDASTTADQIKDHLKETWPNSRYEVNKLNTKGSNASFQIGVDFNESLVDTLYDPSYWPEGIAVKRFKFFRNRRTASFDRK